MHRRSFVIASLVALGAPTIALAQTTQPTRPGRPPPPQIEPQNALEWAFLQALENERLRPSFRRYLMETHVALALAHDATDAPPRELPLRRDFRAAAIFTSSARMDSVLGPAAPRVVINGRAALERVRGKNVAINPGLTPMLTLEPEDVATYLATPGTASAGPTQ